MFSILGRPSTTCDARNLAAKFYERGALSLFGTLLECARSRRRLPISPRPEPNRSSFSTCSAVQATSTCSI